MLIFPVRGVYLELWGEIGVLSYCWVLAPAAQQGPCALHLRGLAWAALSCNLSGLALAWQAH